MYRMAGAASGVFAMWRYHEPEPVDTVVQHIKLHQFEF